MKSDIEQLEDELFYAYEKIRKLEDRDFFYYKKEEFLKKQIENALNLSDEENHSLSDLVKLLIDEIEKLRLIKNGMDTAATCIDCSCCNNRCH